MKKKIGIELDPRKEFNKRMIRLIQQIVCIYYNQPISAATSRSKKRDLVHTRHTIVYMAYKFLDIRLTELAKEVGCDHATILHIDKKLKGYLMWDKVVKREFKDLEHIINVQYDEPGNDINLDQYYFVNLNNVKTLRANRNKAIVFTGYSDNEIRTIIDKLHLQPVGHLYPEQRNIINHTNTGLYLFKIDETKN